MFDVWQNKFAHDIYLQKYSMDGKETWKDTVNRVVENVCADLIPENIKAQIAQLMYERKFIPGGRYLYASGRSFHQVNNCFLFRASDSREGWSDACHKASMALMTGGGIGFDYSDVRPKGAIIKRTGGQATGPIALMNMVNEIGRHVMQGGQRRSAIWAGLSWKHPDVLDFIHLKDHSHALKAAKEVDFTFPMPMELTNISVNYDTDFFNIIWNKSDVLHQVAADIWLENCKQAFSTAEPGMAFNFKNPRESLRNACTEVVSEDDSDKCNLGTLWMNRFTSLSEFRKATELANIFLLCGGIYSDVPTERIREVGLRNNRIGLGLGGMHEWLMQRGMPYEVTPEMHQWLATWEASSEQSALKWSQALNVALPKGKRAIAPNGTIGILAETTTGIEPLFCCAYKRRYYKDGKWHFQYVVDGAVKRLLEQGVKLEHIQDTYDLSFEQRVKFQADVQDYVDMAISSTSNMAAWGSEANGEHNVQANADTLLKYAHRLRGFTCYPDGARGGQPLTKVSLDEALAQEGKVFLEEVRECVNGVCGL